MSDLILYTKTGCPYCAAAVKHYTEQGRTFTEYNVTDHPEKMNDLLKASGGRASVPVIIDGNSVSVGFGGS